MENKAKIPTFQRPGEQSGPLAGSGCILLVFTLSPWHSTLRAVALCSHSFMLCSGLKCRCLFLFGSNPPCNSPFSVFLFIFGSWGEFPKFPIISVYVKRYLLCLKHWFSVFCIGMLNIT